MARRRPPCTFSRKKIANRTCRRMKNGVLLCCLKKRSTKRRRR